MLLEANDARSSWRMLEYWWQVELFRTAPAGWAHTGDFEIPYVTDFAHRSKGRSKWSDLLLHREGQTPGVVVVEMKDLGASADRTAANARGVGFDLASLAAIHIEHTLDLYDRLISGLNPDALTAAARDEGRIAEYEGVVQALAPSKDIAWEGMALVLIRHGDVERVLEQIRSGYAQAEDKVRRAAGASVVKPFCPLTAHLANSSAWFIQEGCGQSSGRLHRKSETSTKLPKCFASAPKYARSSALIDPSTP